MAAPATGDRPRRMFTDETNRYDEKRERLVQCARRLAECRDVVRLSVTDVTKEMGITRGLFYYYFDDKEELARSIVDSYISDLIEGVNNRISVDLDREQAICELVYGVHQWMYDEEGQRRPMWRIVDALNLHDYGWRNASEHLGEIIIERGLLAKYRQIDEAAMREHARFVALGILGETRLQPDVSPDMIADAACASLRYRKRRKEEAEAEEED